MSTDALTKAEASGDAVAYFLNERMLPALMDQLPEAMDEAARGRLAEVALNLVRLNTTVAQCTPESIMGAVLRAHTLSLPIGTGEFWIIPRKNRFKDRTGQWQDRWEATSQIGYQGHITLATRSLGRQCHIINNLVREGDEFRIAHHLETPFIHNESNEPGLREWTDVYCVARIGGEWTDIARMNRAEIEAHRDHYVPKGFEWVNGKRQARDTHGGPWGDAFSSLGMAKKTVVIQWAKRMPLPDDHRRVILEDERAWFGTVDAREPEAPRPPQVSGLKGRILGSGSDVPPQIADDGVIDSDGESEGDAA